MRVYLVGGAVRDKLLDLPVGERDWVVVGATPEEMLERGFRQVGRDFPVFLHPDTGEEYALARTERKTGPGYTGFEVHAAPDVTLEQDLERRDLTINAMAMDDQGRLIDPFNGREDLDAGLLRHVSPAFVEDPVRILRVARFAARFAKWGFRVAHGTNALMRRMVRDGEVAHLVAERVWAELEKALGTDSPEVFFKVLRGCGALAVLFPEIDREFGDDPQAHRGQALPEALEALRRAARHDPDPRVRLAVLLQHLGRDLPPDARQQRADELLARLRAPNDYRRLALAAIRLEDLVRGERPDQVLAFLEGADAFRNPDQLQRLLATYRAGGWIDASRAAFLERAHQAAAETDSAPLREQGLQGPALGEALRSARREQIARLQANSHNSSAPSSSR